MKKKKKNGQIEALRGIIMFMIMFYHYTFRFESLYGIKTICFFSLDKWGEIGVGCFFIISGYFMIPKNLSEYHMKDYLRKKIVRLYPAYLLCMTLTYFSISVFGLEGRETNVTEYFLNMIMLNGFIGVDYVDGAHWYLTYLLLFYIIISILLKIHFCKKQIIIIWTIINVLLKILLNFIPQFSVLFKLSGGNYFSFIIIGILFSEFLDNDNEENKWNFILFFVIIIRILADYGIITTCGICLFLLFYALAVKDKLSILNNKVFIELGGISYIVYLLHQNIGYQILLFFYDICDKFYRGVVFMLMIFIVLLAFVIQRVQQLLWKKIILLN